MSSSARTACWPTHTPSPPAAQSVTVAPAIGWFPPWILPLQVAAGVAVVMTTVLFGPVPQPVVRRVVAARATTVKRGSNQSGAENAHTYSPWAEKITVEVRGQSRTSPAG